MRISFKKVILFAIGFLFMINYSFNAFADTLDSASNKFFSSNNINETLDAQSDVYAVGNNLRFNGIVKADLLVAGNNIDIQTESIGGSIRAAGATITIDSNVERNITVAGASVDIKSGTKAKGIYISSGDVNFEGEAEDLMINGNVVTINGIVTNNVKVNCTKLIIGEKAKVIGNFKVKSEEDMEVLGDFNTNNITFEKINYDKNETRLLGKINILGKFARIITAIILAVLITLLCNKYNNKAVERFEYRPWMPFIIGFATLVILPMAAILLCITIVGIPISIISFIIYGLLIYLAPIFTSVILGKVVLKNMNPYLSAIIFTLIVKMLLFTPYIGGVIIFACILLSLGIFIQNIFDKMTEG